MSKRRKVDVEEATYIDTSKQGPLQERDYVIAVHCGAGYHSTRIESSYRKLMRRACQAAADTLQAGGSVVEAAKICTIQLEDSELSNAGIGSYLNINGEIECDASVMSNQKKFGAVGAIQRCRNPISVAVEIHNQSTIPLSHGRQRPSFLVGNGALSFANECVKESVVPKAEDMETPHTIEKYKMAKGIIRESKEDSDEVQDTIGAIIVDLSGKACATSSSGGMNMKHSGRIGVASMYGCGCWVEEIGDGGDVFVCTTTGNGEELIRNLMASSLGRYIRDNEKKPLNELLKSFSETDVSGMKNYGILSVNVSTGKRIAEIGLGHSTQSMAVGIFSSRMKKPKAFVSRMDPKRKGSGGGMGKSGHTRMVISGYMQSFDN